MCNSNNVNSKLTIHSSQLNTLYKKSFGVDFKSFFEEETFKMYHCSCCHLDFFDPKMAGNAKFYEILQECREKYYNPNRPEFKESLKYINKNDSILEVGCGDGVFASMIKSFKYVGIELNELAVKKAKEKGYDVRRVNLNKYVNTIDKLHDVVISHHVHEHVSDLNGFILDGLSALKNGGYYILSVPNGESEDSASLNHVLNLPPHHISRFTKQSLLHLERFGMELIDLIEVGYVDSNSYRQLLVKNYITKKISKLIFKNEVFINPSDYDRLDRLSSKIPFRASLYLHSKFKINQAPNLMAVYKKKLS